MAHLLNLLILSIGPGINSLIIVLRGNWARRAESRRLVFGGYRQWIEHILTIQNKLNNISEVYITSVIWSRLMETYKQDFYSLRAIWHAQGKFCVKELIRNIIFLIKPNHVHLACRLLLISGIGLSFIRNDHKKYVVLYSTQYNINIDMHIEKIHYVFQFIENFIKNNFC